MGCSGWDDRRSGISAHVSRCAAVQDPGRGTSCEGLLTEAMM